MRNKDLKQVSLKLVGEDPKQLFLELIFLSKYNSSYVHVLRNPGVMQEWTQSGLYYECSANVLGLPVSPKFWYYLWSQPILHFLLRSFTKCQMFSLCASLLIINDICPSSCLTIVLSTVKIKLGIKGNISNQGRNLYLASWDY